MAVSPPLRRKTYQQLLADALAAIEYGEVTLVIQKHQVVRVVETKSTECGIITDERVSEPK